MSDAALVGQPPEQYETVLYGCLASRTVTEVARTDADDVERFGHSALVTQLAPHRERLGV